MGARGTNKEIVGIRSTKNKNRWYRKQKIYFLFVIILNMPHILFIKHY